MAAARLIVVEKHADGYVAYPLGLNGAVLGQGETYEASLADVRSAIAFHLETFGTDAPEADSPVLEAFVAETDLAGRAAAPRSTHRAAR